MEQSVLHKRKALQESEKVLSAQGGKDMDPTSSHKRKLQEKIDNTLDKIMNFKQHCCDRSSQLE
jgi:hypothetical protein